MEDKVVFIAHSYHKKTHSHEFIVNYLKEFYDVDVLFDEEWESGQKIDWSVFSDDYKAVIIWQMFPKREDFERIPNKNIIYFPMYDQAVRWHFNDWLIAKDVKIVSFCKKLHNKLKNWGLNSIYVQYFIEPQEFSPGVENEVFFWQRFSKINIKTIKKILKNSNVKIHLHKTVDPGQEYVAPTPEDEKSFGITYSQWFNTKEQMQDFIKTKGIYIAPRYLEGIGMSFLEAMAQGKVVIANNAPTMNEYIKHGKTGFLCNFKFPRALKLKNIAEIQKNTYEYAKQGYEKWLINRKNIINFINSPVQNNELTLWTKICLPILSLDRKKVIRLKFGHNASLTLLGKKVF